MIQRSNEWKIFLWIWLNQRDFQFLSRQFKRYIWKRKKKKRRVKSRKTIYFYNVCVWIRITYMLLAFCIFFTFLFFALVSILGDKVYYLCTVYVLFMKLTTILFRKIYIKDWFHDTIYIFKNYFNIIFSIFSKINCI